MKKLFRNSNGGLAWDVDGGKEREDGVGSGEMTDTEMCPDGYGTGDI